MKNKFFPFIILIIYLLFLSKDKLFASFDIKNLSTTLNNTKASYYETEYNALTKTLNLNNLGYNIVYSKVIFQDIYDFYNKITILKGTSDNLKKGDIVLNEDGVIGVISTPYNSYSEVSLLTNPNINLSVKINNSYGILKSSDNKIIIENVLVNNPLKEGDKVYTSGLTDIKGGLLIGTIKKIEVDDLGLEYKIEVNPSASLYNLNYLGVLP